MDIGGVAAKGLFASKGVAALEAYPALLDVFFVFCSGTFAFSVEFLDGLCQKLTHGLSWLWFLHFWLKMLKTVQSGNDIIVGLLLDNGCIFIACFVF